MLEDAYKEMEKKSQQPEEEKNSQLTDNEMGKLKEIQQKYLVVQTRLGQISVTKIRLEQQFNELLCVEKEIKQKYLDIQNEEKEFVTDITKKYGDGQLDLSTGKFEADSNVNEDKKVENTEK